MKTQLILDDVVADQVATTLTAAAAAGATSLAVETVAGFGATPSRLSLNGVKYDCVGATANPPTLTLDTGLTAAAAAGDVVAALSAADETRTTTLAYCGLSIDSDPHPYTVDTTRTPWLTVDTPHGTIVTVDEDLDLVIGRGDIDTDLDLTTAVNVPDPVAVVQDPPATSPTPEVIAWPDHAQLVVPDAAHDTALDVYLTDDPTDPIDATTLLEAGVRSLPYTLSALPASLGGAQLLSTSAYYVAVWAQNAAGDAPAPSAWIPFTLDPLGSDYIASLKASKIASDDLTATLALIGKLKIGLAMLLDQNGQTINKTNGRPTVLSADPDVANQITGQLIADAAWFLDNVSRYGLNNILAGRDLLTSGVPNPSAAPRVSVDWDSLDIDDISYFPRGMYDAGSSWYVTEGVFGTGNVWSVDKTTGHRTLVKFFSNFTPNGGITRIGTTWYVLGQDANRDSNWYVFLYDASWTKTGEWAVSLGMPNGGAIGNDGTNLLIGRTDSTSTVKITTHTPATGGTVTGAITGTTWTVSGDPAQVTSITKTSSGFSGARFVLTAGNTIRVYDTGGTRQTSDEWPAAAGPVVGCSHDGTVWHTHDGTTVWHYTNLVGIYRAGYTWRDDDTGGSGTAETQISTSLASITMRRQRLTVSIGAPPDDGTSDGANTASIYVGVGSSGTLYRQTQLPEGTLAATYSTVLTSGSTSPGTNGFASRTGAVGQIASAASDGTNPLAYILGSGGARFAKLIQAGTVSGNVTTAGTPVTSSFAFPVAFDTAPKVFVVAITGNGLTVTANPTGTPTTTGASAAFNRSASTGTVNAIWIATTAF